MKQKQAFTIKDVVAIGVGAAPLCGHCDDPNSSASSKYQHSIAIRSSSPL